MSDVAQKSNLKLVHDRDREWTAPEVPKELRGIQLWHCLGLGPQLQNTDELKRPATRVDGSTQLLSEWSTRPLATEADNRLQHLMKLNPSLRLGAIPGAPPGTPEYGVIDFDGEDEEYIRRGKEIVERKVGRKLCWRMRDGTMGQMAIIRAVGGAGSLGKLGIKDGRPKPHDRKGNGVDILLRGCQVVLDGDVIDRYAHNELRRYRWPDGYPLAIELPEVGPELLAEIVDELRQAAIECGWSLDSITRVGAASPKSTAIGEPAPSLEAALDCLRKVKNVEGSRFDDRNKFVGLVAGIEVMCAPYRGDDEVEDAIWSVYLMYPGNDEEYVRHILDSDLDKDRGYTYVMEITGQGLALAQIDFDDGFVEAHPDFVKGAKPSVSAPKPITATPFVLRDPAAIEPRQWLYGRHYIRRYVSATVAPPGLGKSSLVLVEMIAMASGKNLLGHMPAEKLRVWYWNGEDPQEENERRAVAICKQHGITAEDLGGRLFINSGRDAEITIARVDRDGVRVAEPVTAALGRTIRDNNIDVLVIDPFVASHAVPENDNGAINAVCRQWAMLAEETGCAIELVHHVRKGAAGQTEYTVDDARGAGATVAAARSVRVLNRMSKDEASKAGIPSPRAFFRVDNGKANLAPPAENSTWRQIVSVSLGNDRGAVRGDSVGVVTSWEWPDRVGGLTSNDIRAVQEAIAGGEWRSNVQANERWAGHAVADALDLDLDEAADKASVKSILKSLIGDGLLKIVERADENRKVRTFVKVGEKVNKLRKNNGEGGEKVNQWRKSNGEIDEAEASEW